MRDDLDGCLCAQGAAQKNAATRTDNDSKEVWGKKTHPVAQAVTYLRPGTAAKRVLDRSSRPDTGRREDSRPPSPALLYESQDSTTDTARVPQGTGHTLAPSSEAHPL